MVCGGFACSRNALCALNVVYVLVGLLLIGVAAWGKGFGIVSSLHIIGGVIAVGFFLLLIAIVGFIGAINHHQVMLFFVCVDDEGYIVILGLVFAFQFGVSCSCLALKASKQESLLSGAWKYLDPSTKNSLENSINCCGLFNHTDSVKEFRKDFAACTANYVNPNADNYGEMNERVTEQFCFMPLSFFLESVINGETAARDLRGNPTFGATSAPSSKATSRLLMGTGQYAHMTPVLRQLHWLPIEARAQFKVLIMTYKALNGLGPGYLNERLRPYMPDHPLRSAGESLLREPSMKEIRRSRNVCPSLQVCKTKNVCPTCGKVMMEHAGEALKILGGVGLFFSFTEVLGVWLAMRYRNQKDPRANPSAFL
ncbi:Tetraspanin-31 [Varanus komodoensis]|nr:Tetraspanin-31 [Varanus komodoensis]